MSKKIVQLDFMKCVFILHVVMIHLVYLGQTYPWLKEFFLFFTTPVFFVISGFLAHVDKPFVDFCQKVKWWLIPYLIMEGLYIMLASVLPINEHIDQLDIIVFLRKLTMEPLGPYWYIHNLIISYVAYYAVAWLYRNKIKAGALLLTAAFIGILVVWLGIISWHCCIFFTMGVCHRRHHRGHYFLAVFLPCLDSQPVAYLCDDCILVDGIQVHATTHQERSFLYRKEHPPHPTILACFHHHHQVLRALVHFRPDGHPLYHNGSGLHRLWLLADGKGHGLSQNFSLFLRKGSFFIFLVLISRVVQHDGQST